MSEASFHVYTICLSGTTHDAYRRIFNRGGSRNSCKHRVSPHSLRQLILSTPLFKTSTVVDQSKPRSVQKSTRDSYTAYLKMPSNLPEIDDDVIVNCIEQRASEFQGHIPTLNFETLQVIKSHSFECHYWCYRYYNNGRFRVHYDWLPDTVPSFKHSGNRATSFFVYLQVDCQGGATVFPAVERPISESWCEFLNCKNETGHEVPWLEVKPKVGTALFWYNIQVSGEVDMKTLHAGAPVFNGTKIGLNIWTRERSWRDL